MRLGITSPIVTRLPGVAGEWEATAGIAELADIGAAADELGFEYLSCSEHVAVPAEIAAQRGGTYWDPLSTFGFLAGRTRSIRFLTQVLVLGYHHPLAIAKRYGTLDAISGGRVTLGVGVGSLREEFELLGVEFEGRGERADDALRALRASLSASEPEYAGTHYRFGGLIVEPCAMQERLPIWVGGRTQRSLRRAIDLGDGWVPFGLSRSWLREMLESVEVPDRFEIVLGAGPLDPEDADRTTVDLEKIHAAGATIVGVTIRASSADHYISQLRRLAELAGLEGRSP
ncbi:LLM class F420-dependent oxidoreductase [Gordonia amicalis]|uniref:LLM class F420-dependent oxidoreductase n=1 Tax=Gordonia amicalis TaxID=89053 RepID=A0ABU4DHC0_9ACTN|nr:LLM class F420-dependent oxidoreductase [Gordonia amicalis]MBA5849003.1 LLM class F420-dependent oxidoreductase [Gordonia amicalis]MDV6309141.1 LLM class F420-dependent oxidoreductase [Gordonia amicalis]MDV7174147.1 LLM class F420-dependent oxidoreductase [Gordonia amicalis]NKX77803.1 LLM class F420-dependent oxidoreductase [Gordonia amicalis]UOG20754.1 LLM class F420-dependent oxidoreductase [Gordonia amicalis]